MSNKTFFVMTLALLFSCTGVFADELISEFTENKIAEFMTLRMKLSTLDSNEAALAAIDDFEAQNAAALKEQAVDYEQEALIMYNFYELERFNYRFNDAAQRPSTKNMLQDLVQKDSAWYEAHDRDKTNKWLNTLTGDAISCYMSFSWASVMKYGLKVKPYYEQSLEQDPDLAYTNTNIAQWYYYAPAIGGGSKKTARKYFERAVQVAKTDAERYFADIYLSQFLFEYKEFDEAKRLLDEADSLNPGSSYIATIRAENADGRSLYAYNRRRSKIDDK